MKDDDGVIAVIVALMAVVLFGFAAIVIDIGALYEERRELQSGSDAGALASANECIYNDCSLHNVMKVANDFASSNAQDEHADADVCGNGDASWTSPCEPPAGLPLGAKYVRVKATTRNSDGTKLLPPVLAAALDEKYAKGAPVAADTVVVWGSPARTGKTLPLIISGCEWKTHTQAGTKYAPLPSYAADGTPYYDGPTGPNPYPVAFEAEILTQGGSGEVCKVGGGFNEDIPGGFGWLETDKECEAVIASEGDTETVDSKQGFSPCVRKELAGLVDTIVEMPIFAEAPDGTTYTISGWASFYVTGYVLNGNSGRHEAHVPTWDALPNCFSQANYDCVTGYFLDLPASSGAVGGAPFGETVIQVYE